MRREIKAGISETQLKYFACFFMLIDHLAHIWNPFLELSGSVLPPPLWTDAMYFLGRLAFPIFVFFVAEGCLRTRDIRRYLLRLGLFALVAQIPYTLALFSWRGRVFAWGGSVILTFFLGVLGVFCYQELRGRCPAPAACLPALALATLAWTLNTDYSWMGVLLVLALYLCGEDHRKRLLCLALGLAVLYLAVQPLQYLFDYWIVPGEPLAQPLPALLREYVRQHGLWHLVVTGCALAALLPLSFYRGERGGGSKWFFYWFYPGHLAALFALQFLRP